MKILENKIINDAKNTLLNEDLEDLKENGKLGSHFATELKTFQTFKQFEMNELTKSYIKLYEEAMKKIETPNFSEEDFEKLREEFIKEAEKFQYKYPSTIYGNIYILDNDDCLKIKDNCEMLSFSIYHFMKNKFENIENENEEELKSLYNLSFLIHNYVRNFGFTYVADSIAEVKIFCREKLNI